MKLDQIFVLAVSINREPAEVLTDEEFAVLLLDDTSEHWSLLSREGASGTLNSYDAVQRAMNSGLLVDRDDDAIRSRGSLLNLIQNQWHHVDIDTGEYNSDVNNMFYWVPAHLLSLNVLTEAFTVTTPTGMPKATSTAVAAVVGSAQPEVENQRQPWLL